jgi:hypothetical protein
MTTALTEVGYIQTKEKLARLEERLAGLKQTQMNAQHRAEAQRSCEEMISQYRREIKLYEAAHSESSTR